MMPMPLADTLSFDVIEAERMVVDMEQLHGKDSSQYEAARKHFLRLWFMLKLTRRQNEFLKEITR